MVINKAVITAAGSGQRSLPMQTLVDRDGKEKTVLNVIVEEVLRAKVEEICIVVRPGDEIAYAEGTKEYGGRIQFIHQEKPLGYGHAIFCAREFVGREPFLHLVGDHLYVSRTAQGCAEHLTQVAASNACAVSAVQETRETLLPYYGTVGGQPVHGQKDLYRIETVVEKPTPTEAERNLIMPGLRAGHYLCFFGMHVLTPTVMEILDKLIRDADQKAGVWLADALTELANREQYLALRKHDWRYDIGARYGLLRAQLALAFSGQDRDQVLALLLELFASREFGSNQGQG
ncbi:MAG TPA: sugar phosphate nucleotidyltransferase [Patescibacteria group bacterium]|nr:sugar phosphate nucleotidyltransferase [Patescibacteria group bacterium]